MENQIFLYVALLFCIGSIIFCALTFAFKPTLSPADKDALEAFNELYLKNIYIDEDNDQMIFKLPTLGLKIAPTAASNLFSGTSTPTQYLFELNGLPSEGSGTYTVMKVTSPSDATVNWSFLSDGTTKSNPS